MTATVILCILLAAALAYGVYSIRGRLLHGCCGAEGDAPKIKKPRDRDPAHYPHAYLLGVEGMTCGNCVRRVESRLFAHGGLLAGASLKRGQVIVLSKEEIPEDTLSLLVTRAGYRPTLIRPVSAARPGAAGAQELLRQWKKGELQAG